MEEQQRSSNRLTNSILARWVHFQPDHTNRPLGWKSHYVREIGIERDEDATVIHSEPQHLFVCRSRETRLEDGNSVIPFESQLRSVLCGKIFVEQEPHWFASTISSAASRAAYSRLALICSALSCGYAARMISFVSPAASFSR